MKKINVADWNWPLFLIGVAGSGFSLPVGRLFLLLSLVCLLASPMRRQWRFPVTGWLWLAFLVVAFWASATGVNPGRSLGKFDKLIWFMGIPVACSLVNTNKRFRQMLISFVIGSCILALDVIVIRGIESWNAYQSTEHTHSLFWEVVQRGSMTDGQILMIAILALIGWIGMQGKLTLRWKLISVGMLLLMIVAEVVNFKRGSWVVSGFSIGVMFLWTKRWRWLALMALAILGMLLLPPVQQRLGQLRQEFDMNRGGRIVMWTQVAPPLIREHPFGIGYRAMTPELMQSTAIEAGYQVEQRRDHLHSNPIQILVATGWLGFMIYAVWMGWALVSLVLKTRQGDREMRLAFITSSLMLLALLLNGLVEYNFGDSEIVLITGMLVGLSGVSVKENP